MRYKITAKKMPQFHINAVSPKEAAALARQLMSGMEPEEVLHDPVIIALNNGHIECDEDVETFDLDGLREDGHSTSDILDHAVRALTLGDEDLVEIIINIAKDNT